MRFGLISTVLVGYLAGLCDADDVKPGSMTWADKLKKDLFVNYDRTNRPTQHYNVTNVKVGMAVRHIDIDEVSSIFTVTSWINMQWTDEKLKWNSEDYGDLKLIQTNAESIWKPDLLLYNNAKASDIDHFGQTDVLIYNDGKVLWVPPTEYHTFCRLNLRLWPFDQQTCYVKIGSWVHDALSLNLTLNRKPELDTIDESEVWAIQNITVKHNVITYECCPEPYIDIEYYFTVKRTSSSYVAVVSPLFVILLLTLSVFWLPPHCPEKIVLNVVILMIAISFLIYFAIQIPLKYGNTPLVVIFFSTTLYLTAFGATLSGIVVKICRINHTRPVPRLIRRSLLEGRWVGSILDLGCPLLPPYEDKEIDGNQEEIGDVAIRDWCRLTGLIDRWTFAGYLVVFFIAFIWCLV